MPGTPEAAVTELDFARIGDLLTRLPAVAVMMRHTSVQSTLGYVCADPEEPEQAFVRDILTEPLSTVIEKWYGGDFHAAGLGAMLAASVLTPARAD